MPEDKKIPEEFCKTRKIKPSYAIRLFGEDKREAKIYFGGESVTYSGELSVDESAKTLFKAFHHLLKLEANKDLRQLLWLRHGCNITSLYGDDGEMQCGKCLIDFKRDAPEDILKRFDKIGLEKMIEGLK